MNAAAPARTPTLSLVDPHQAHAVVHPSYPESLGVRVLELTSRLQTTLDLDRQIDIFVHEATRSVPLDGVRYCHNATQLDIVNGLLSSRRATYDLRLEQDDLGGVEIYRDLPFAESELTSLENLLTALIYPLRNALAYRQALEEASHDPLTGIRNRCALQHLLPREVSLAQREGRQLALSVLDLDHFKDFNDRYGHSFGDEVLKTVAQVTASCIRSSDLLFRLGGEEFVLVSAHEQRDGGRDLAERVRREIDRPRLIRGRSVHVTVSIGVAALRDNDDHQALFERADQALYAAKHAGRNRVTVDD